MSEEIAHFFDGESLSGFDGGAAGHGVEHGIEEISASHFSIGLNEFFGEVADDANEPSAGDEDRAGVNEQRGASEVLNVEAHFCEEVCGFENCSGFDGGAFDGFGDEQSLGFDVSGEDSLAERFVHDAFVKRVLVDDFDAGITGDDDVTVVDLEGAEFVGEYL